MAEAGEIENPRCWESPALLAASLCGALGVQLLSRGLGPGFSLPEGGGFKCPGPVAGIADSLDLFLGRVEWQAMIILESVVACFAFVLAIQIILGIRRRKRPDPAGPWKAVLAIGAFLLALDLAEILSMWLPADWGHAGFLSRLLATLPPECGGAKALVVWGRLLGEPAGLAVGVAMYAAATLPRTIDRPELARRGRHLNHLLYAASVLFVVGLLMSRANFAWILAQWDWARLGLAQGARQDIVHMGVLICGVAYSAILAVFFLPARWILQKRIDLAVPEGEDPAGTRGREDWLKANGFSAGWKDDIKQILAVLAPALSAPLFDVLAK